MTRSSFFVASVVLLGGFLASQTVLADGDTIETNCVNGKWKGGPPAVLECKTGERYTIGDALCPAATRDGVDMGIQAALQFCLAKYGGTPIDCEAHRVRIDSECGKDILGQSKFTTSDSAWASDPTFANVKASK